MPLRCPPLGANPGLVGTAFDTALRVLLRGANRQMGRGDAPLVARLAALHMDPARVRTDVGDARSVLDAVAAGGGFGDGEARAAVVLASYEVVARTGRYQDLAGVVPDAAWRDVLALIRAVPLQAFAAQRQLVVGPLFRAARRVGGADADLLLDDALIEVKATKDLRLDRRSLQQLAAYLVLERLGGIPGSSEPVRRLGVYFARHGALHVLEVREAFVPGGLPRLVT